MCVWPIRLTADVPVQWGHRSTTKNNIRRPVVPGRILGSRGLHRQRVAIWRIAV